MECPVCNSTATSIYKKTYKCIECNHVYVDYPDDGLNYHKNEYRRNNHGTRGSHEIVNGLFTDSFHNFRKNICQARINSIEEILPECNTLLDIGAGGGTFVNAIKHNFDIVECQEISDICVNNLKNYGYKTYQGDFNTINFDISYDLVTCWHVLEHIKDIHLFVKNVSKITNKYLVLEVPLIKSKGARTRGIGDLNVNQWDGHYHYFSQHSMRKLFETHFDILDMNEPGIQSPALLILLKSKSYEL
jgi:hypothetical protein